ncbi:hypothetical protein BGX27_001046 [Mortierella sp. AM989]|nr:hypothetical protein BGX27_001046 [Mortierella sp. AM989]
MFISDDNLNNTYFTDNPPDPIFFNEPLEPDFIQPFISSNTPPLSINHDLLYPPPKNGQGHPRELAASDVSLLSQHSLLSLDDLGWFDPPSSSKAISASASASSVPATLQQSDTSGFDQLSLFDEVCSSAFNTPFTPHLDTPDQTPNQTPLFECVASEDLDTTSFEQFWSAAEPSFGDVSVVTQGSNLNLDLNLGLTSPAFSSTTSPLPSTNLSGQGVVAQDSNQINARLQAENALLDFVLFDDIAPSSPITTLLTPAMTSLSSPSIDDLKFKQEIETHELAMQLVAAAAASMTSQSSTVSAQSSPFEADSSDIIGSLFSDVDLSPLMEPVSPAATTSSPQATLDWMSSQLPQNFSFDFNNNLNNINNVSTNPFTMQSSPMLPVAVTSPQLDLGLLLSLYQQQQQQQQYQQSSLFASTIPSMTTTVSQPDQTIKTTTNPLKRKSDEIKEPGEESPRQFACSQCGRAFSRLFNLNTHERTHDRSKARLFPCPEQGCKKSFTRKNDLQRHQISIHGVMNIYSCQKCKKSFSRRDALRRHMELKNCEDDDEEDLTHNHSHSN